MTFPPWITLFTCLHILASWQVLTLHWVTNYLYSIYIA